MRSTCKVVLILCSLTSCALTNAVVTPPSLGSGTTRSAAGMDRTINIVLPFNDNRPFPGLCGIKKNAYNSRMADVFCSQPPSQWLAHVLSEELSRSGFHVLSTASSEWDGVTIEGDLLQFFVEPKINAITVDLEADIHVRLIARSKSGLEASREFFVKGVNATMFATDNSFQSASDKAAKEIVRQMASAIVDLLRSYPELGRGPVNPGPSI